LISHPLGDNVVSLASRPFGCHRWPHQGKSTRRARLCR